MRIALTIAGSDSGGGAGIQADLKTFHQFGVFGTSALVAITAQNTMGVTAVHAIPEDIVRAQLKALADDLPPDAIKTGMLATADLVTVVAAAIKEHGFPGRYIHFPQFGEEFFKQLVAEQYVMKTSRTGHSAFEWVKTYPNNEILDIMVYNLAAYHIVGNPRKRDDWWTSLEAGIGVAPTKPKAAPPAPGKQGPPAGKENPKDTPPAPKPRQPIRRRRSNFW